MTQRMFLEAELASSPGKPPTGLLSLGELPVYKT
jgi:hypothetical protein